MKNKLKAVGSVSFQAQFSMSTQQEGYLWKGRRFLVEAIWPDCLRIVPIDATAQGGNLVGTKFDTFVSNGADQIEIDPVGKWYIMGKGRRSLTSVTTVCGLPSHLGCDVILSRAWITGFRRAKGDDMASAGVYRRMSARDWFKRIDGLSFDENGFPLKLAIWRRLGMPPQWQELVVVEYSDWNLDAQLTKDMFRVAPPEGFVPPPIEVVQRISPELPHPHFRVQTPWHLTLGAVNDPLRRYRHRPIEGKATISTLICQGSYDFLQPSGTMGTVDVGLEAPRPDSKFEGDETWVCCIVITKLGETKVRPAYGVDSLQALQIGVRMLRMHVENLQHEYPGQITFDGSDDLM